MPAGPPLVQPRDRGEADGLGDGAVVLHAHALLHQPLRKRAAHVAAPRLADGHLHPGRVHGAGLRVHAAQQAHGVHAHPLVPAAEVLVPQPHLDGHRITHHAGVHVHAGGESAVRRLDLHLVALLHLQAAGGVGVHLRPRVPRHLGDGVRQLQQPGAVARAAVEEAVGRIHHQVQPVLRPLVARAPGSSRHRSSARARASAPPGPGRRGGCRRRHGRRGGRRRVRRGGGRGLHRGRRRRSGLHRRLRGRRRLRREVAARLRQEAAPPACPAPSPGKRRRA